MAREQPAAISASSVVAPTQTVELDELGVARQHPGRRGRGRRVEHRVEVVTRELEQAAVVEVAQPAAGDVDGRKGRSTSSRGDAVRPCRRRPAARRRPPRRWSSGPREQDVDVVGERPVDGELLDLDAVERLEVGERGLEERPLVALPVDGRAERQHRRGLQPVRVEELDPRRRRSSSSRRTAVPARAGGGERTAPGRDRQPGHLAALTPELVPHVARPAVGVEPVPDDQREGDALEAEAEAGGVRDLALSPSNT